MNKRIHKSFHFHINPLFLLMAIAITHSSATVILHTILNCMTVTGNNFAQSRSKKSRKVLPWGTKQEESRNVTGKKRDSEKRRSTFGGRPSENNHPVYYAFLNGVSSGALNFIITVIGFSVYYCFSPYVLRDNGPSQVSGLLLNSFRFYSSRSFFRRCRCARPTVY